MQTVFEVFRIENGKLETAFPIADSLYKVAADAMNAIRDGDEDFEQCDLDAIATLAIEIIAGIHHGTIPKPKYIRDDDSEAEILNAFLCDSEERKSISTSTGDNVFEWQVIAAYSLYKTDLAARHFNSGDTELGIESLSLACLASADFAYHWAFFDSFDPEAPDGYSATLAIKGFENAFETKRMKAIPALKSFASLRWKSGNNGRPWKSRRSCARAIAGDVVTLARELGWDMAGAEPERTVYKWLRE